MAFETRVQVTVKKDTKDMADSAHYFCVKKKMPTFLCFTLTPFASRFFFTSRPHHAHITIIPSIVQ
jgi:hypothetical protein